MFRNIAILLVIGAFAIGATLYHYEMILNPSPTTPVTQTSIYDFTMKDIDGNEVDLGQFRGKVLLIVNTASQCGYTPQYEQLEAVYEKYKEQDFVVLGFPANNFMGQEPGTEAQIKEFCNLRYHVTFPMFSKISVKGADQHPFYNFLTHKETNPQWTGDITWNFEKFLIDANGKVIARFPPKTRPDDPDVIKAIASAIAERHQKV